MAVNWRIFEDPDFQALPEEERRKGFAEVAGSDPEFQGLPKEEQLKGYTEIVRPSPIITEPGHPWLEPMTTPVAPPTPAPELVAAHPPVAPEQPLIVRTPRGIESRDIMGRRPPILAREAGLAPITTEERVRRDVAAGLRYGTQAVATEPYRQAADLLRSYGRFVGIQAEPGDVLAEAATNRETPPATLPGMAVAFPGEAVAGLAPALEAAALGLTGTPVLGAFLVNRFLSEYGAGKPMPEVAEAVGKEALSLGAMVGGAGLAARFVAPGVGVGVERAVSRAVGAGPAEGVMAPRVARAAAAGAERVSRAVGAAVPVYVNAKLEGASDAEALKAGVELGLLDIGMGLRHGTVRQNVERAVRKAGAQAWAARAMSPEAA